MKPVLPVTAHPQALENKRRNPRSASTGYMTGHSPARFHFIPGHAGAGKPATTSKPPVAGTRPDHPAISVLALDDIDELHRHEQALDELAQSAGEPNVFLEPWMLFPALASFGRRKPLIFLLFFMNAGSDKRTGLKLCGFIPLERCTQFYGLPFPVLKLWRYPHSFLTTPLLRKGWAGTVINAFFAWIRNHRNGALLLELSRVSCTGELHNSLEHLTRRRALETADTRYERAIFRPRKNTECYLREALPKKRHKEFRRRQRRLSELGELVFDKMGAGDDPAAWIGEFLRLEASGWKGRQGTALAARRKNREFFQKFAAEAASRGRLEMLALRLEGRAIAMKCNLLARNGGFGFKIAYDEDFYRYSPGVLLEMEQIRRLHEEDARHHWMDSCADPDNYMANRMLLDRRPLRTVVTSTGHPLGNTAVRIIRCLKTALHFMRRSETWRSQLGTTHETPAPQIEAPGSKT